MTDIHFYHLTSTSPDQALPRLLEKSLQAKLRALVRVSSDEEAERINSLLWNYTPDSFLPHGTRRDGYSEQQPIYITAEDEHPNAASILIRMDGRLAEDTTNFQRVLDVFNGADAGQLAAARQRWKHYQDTGHILAYVRQNESGGWEKQSI